MSGPGGLDSFLGPDPIDVGCGETLQTLDIYVDLLLAGGIPVAVSLGSPRISATAVPATKISAACLPPPDLPAEPGDHVLEEIAPIRRAPLLAVGCRGESVGVDHDAGAIDPGSSTTLAWSGRVNRADGLASSHWRSIHPSRVFVTNSLL
jgi:hypothetical protein